MIFNKKQVYYCDGCCESCKYGKKFNKNSTIYYTCDPNKVKELKVITPVPPK